VVTFVESAALAAGDDEVWKRKLAVKDTATKFQSGEKVTGTPTLIQLLTGDAKKVITKVSEWLELESTQDTICAQKWVTPNFLLIDMVTTSAIIIRLGSGTYGMIEDGKRMIPARFIVGEKKLLDIYGQKR
jgi:hypothetical protein